MSPPKVVVIGCGVVGATTAYELSRLEGVEVTVLDQQQPAQGSTGAALGVLMGIISHKTKGRNWRLRQTSLQRYSSLIPELEACLARPLPWNHQGILSLCLDANQVARWESLQKIRQEQGYALEIWSVERLQQRCPDINSAGVAAAIYSPQDGQIDPTALTLACVEAARTRGVAFHFNAPVTGFTVKPSGQVIVHTGQATYLADEVILTAGLGTSELTRNLQEPVAIGPVLGQAVRIHLEQPINQSDFQPVINAQDVHLVPLGGGDYWVGATVEFPIDQASVEAKTLKPQADCLEDLMQVAVAYCPALAKGTVTQTWLGLRPRPQGQAAPIIQPLGEYRNILVAAGHYRNGVLLAPATALAVAERVRSQYLS